VLLAGLASDLRQAGAFIVAGMVVAGEHRVLKPGQLLDRDIPLRLKKRAEHVSRGFQKLAAAVDRWGLSFQDRVCLDLGASTGGFTEFLLERGARWVFAVDVGTNQLHWKIRNDPRVICLERTHAKDLDQEKIPLPLDCAVVDVSFTSLAQVLPFLLPLLQRNGLLLTLFKPQFECRREEVERGGVVQNQQAVDAALARFAEWCNNAGLEMVETQPCALKGRRGNQEWFVWLKFS
jgi:23S rRNA (cytidine1920-2'-O)/16S rRNA (cytidine1409-2'-O)-methyltransferase